MGEEAVAAVAVVVAAEAAVADHIATSQQRSADVSRCTCEQELRIWIKAYSQETKARHQPLNQGLLNSQRSREPNDQSHVKQ